MIICGRPSARAICSCHRQLRDVVRWKKQRFDVFFVFLCFFSSFSGDICEGRTTASLWARP